MNKFGDLTSAEFASTYLGVKMPFNNNTQKDGKAKDSEADPTKYADIDWRTKNVLTAVKDQGQCGSCWAFSTTGSLEAVLAIAGKGVNSLSE